MRLAPYDKIPPQSLEGEQAVLGSMLIEKGAISKARTILDPGHFYRDAHRVVYEAICSLDDRGIEVDELTVTELLRSQEVLENIGGPSYLIQLQNAVPSAANVTYYARIVEEKAVLRKLIDASNQLQALAHSEYDDLGSQLVKAQRCVELAVHRPKYKFIDDELPVPAGSFLQTVGDPPPMLIDQIFPDRSLVLWVGKPKAGKSLFVLDLCEAVSRGINVYGTFGVNKPGPVLYIDMENPPHEIANRLLKRGIKPGAESQLYIKRANFRLDATGIARMNKWVDAIKPAFIVVDSAREALGIKDWYGDPGEITDKVRPVREFAQSVCPILMVAHSRKSEADDAGDEISANNAFAGAVDGWASVRKVEFNTDRSLVHHYQVRGRGMLHDFVAKLSPEDLSVRVLDETEQSEQSHQAEYAKVEAMLKMTKEPVTAQEIQYHLDRSQPHTSRLISQMVKNNFIKPMGKVKREGMNKAAETYHLYSFIHDSIGNEYNSAPDSAPNPQPSLPTESGPLPSHLNGFFNGDTRPDLDEEEEHGTI